MAMGIYDSARKALNTAKDKAAEVLGDDTVENLKSWKDDLAGAGEKVLKVAQEVSEDCDNGVLRNARDFYTNAAKKTGKGLKASVRAAEALSEEDDGPRTVREDLTDTGKQLKQLAKEVLADCDNDALKDARAFYAGAASSARTGVRDQVRRAKSRSEARKRRRAAARQRRAALRGKLTGKAGVLLVCLIIVATLLISFAFWIGSHPHGKTAPQQETEPKTQYAPEPSQLSARPDAAYHTR
ncbi:MAG: hypothetical protein IJV40_16045 [Oscillospiraceae bacterium]|nr:hypothetical protein [Oscillospiraceae bacterium]